MRTLRLLYESRESLAFDCQRNLCKGRAFAAGAAGVLLRDRCVLEIALSDAPEVSLRLDAEAVWIDKSGVGLELLDFDSVKQTRLEDFVRRTSTNIEPSRPAVAGGAQDVYDRIRNLCARERDAVARHGTLPERVALERTFAAGVWESLLQNPQLTPPEVARIAKNGTLPRPLVGLVVGHAGWIACPEVQRALLSNPRCAGPDLERVLRAMPRSELLHLLQHCPYRGEVRTLAQKLARNR